MQFDALVFSLENNVVMLSPQRRNGFKLKSREIRSNPFPCALEYCVDVPPIQSHSFRQAYSPMAGLLKFPMAIVLSAVLGYAQYMMIKKKKA